jgi:hypothetical protein
MLERLEEVLLGSNDSQHGHESDGKPTMPDVKLNKKWLQDIECDLDPYRVVPCDGIIISSPL